MTRRLMWIGMIALAGWFSLWGMTDLFILIVLAWAFSQTHSLPASVPLGYGALLGLIKDFTSSSVFGGWAIAFAAVAWLATQGSRTIERDHPLAQTMWVAIFAAIATWIHLFLGVVSDDRLSWGVFFAYPWIFSSLMTGVLSLVLFPLIKSVVNESHASGMA